MTAPWKTLSFFLLLLLVPLGTVAFADGETPPAETPAEEAATEELPVGPDSQRSPRATMDTFLSSVPGEKWDAAVGCLDFSKITPEPDGATKQRLATQLKGVIDRMAWVDTATLSDRHDASSYLFPPDAADQPIVIARGEDGAWRFEADTVAGIDELFTAWEDKPLLVKSTPWYRQNTLLGNNEPWRPIALALALLVGWIVGKVVRYMLTSTGDGLQNRNRRYTGATLKALGRASVPLFLVFGLGFGLNFLKMNPQVESIALTVISVLFTLATAWIIYCLVDVVDEWLHAFAEKTPGKMDDLLAPMVCTTLRASVVVLTLVQIATVLSDKPMTSVIAGLGVGGLAVGLAAQDMIKNFFGSLMIFSDRPFELEDRVVLCGFDGVVEQVGFRSTRIRTLDGHVVTIPNGTVAGTEIKNIAKRPSIKKAFNIGVTYDTPAEKVRRAKEILEEVFADHEGMAPEMPARIYFNDFLDSALNISVIFWYHPPDYWGYCAFVERTNLEILERFNAEGIEFAFPTQTLFLAGDANRPLPAAG